MPSPYSTYGADTQDTAYDIYTMGMSGRGSEERERRRHVINCPVMLLQNSKK